MMIMKNHGFSLIEVLVSLLLFSFGILGLVALQGRATMYSIDAEDRSRAALLADEIISAMWMQGTSSPTSLAAWMARVKDPSASGLPVPAANPPTVATDPTTGVTTITITWKSPSKLASGSNSQYVTSVVIP